MFGPDEVQEITLIAQRIASESIRNMGRGTGGANLAVPVTRPGTVVGDANAGAEVQVRPDGDANPVPAVNAAGYNVNAGERVLVQWMPPLGVYVTHILDRSARGEFSPQWFGTSANATGVTTHGVFYRLGDLVTIRAKMQHGVGSNTGTGLNMGGLPFTVRTTGYGLAAHGHGHFFGGGLRWPAFYVVSEGYDYGPLQAPMSMFAPPNAGLPYEDAGSNLGGTPFAWGNGAEVQIDMTYETDAP